MAKISAQSVQRVKAENDIVEIIGQYVQLKRAGSRWMGLCPFHTDSQPSFYVSPDLGDHGLFKCFGCGAAGDAIKFIQLKESLSYPDAIQALADRRGITLEWEGGKSERPPAGRHDLLEWAMQFYEGALWGAGGKRARDLLVRRKVSEETARRFRLGFAPEGWSNLLDAARRQGRDLSVLEKLGLSVKKQENNSLYDRFRNRLMFPVWNAMGRVVGFGARAMSDEDQPKYLNSPESDLFAKRQLLYALHLARDAIRREGVALLCEGYMDAIALHQAGFMHAVAGLGTALSEHHVRTLKRLAGEVVLVYDSDEAGRKATVKAIDLLLKEEVPTRVVEFGEGEDPDDFVKKHGAAAMREKLASAPDAFDYTLEAALRGKNLASSADVSEVVREIGRVLAGMPSTLVRVRSREKLAARLGAGDEAALVSMAVTPERAARIQADRLAEILQVDVKVVERELARHGVSVGAVKQEKGRRAGGRRPKGKWEPWEEPGAPIPGKSPKADPGLLARKGLLAVLLMGYREAAHQAHWQSREGRQQLATVCEYFATRRPRAHPMDPWIERLAGAFLKQESPDLKAVLASEGEEGQMFSEAFYGISTPATAGREIQDYLEVLGTLEQEEQLGPMIQEIRGRKGLAAEEADELLKKVQRIETEKHQYT